MVNNSTNINKTNNHSSRQMTHTHTHTHTTKGLYYTENLRSSSTNPTKTRVALGCSGRDSSSCFTYATSRVTLAKNPV